MIESNAASNKIIRQHKKNMDELIQNIKNHRRGAESINNVVFCVLAKKISIISNGDNDDGDDDDNSDDGDEDSLFPLVSFSYV